MYMIKIETVFFFFGGGRSGGGGAGGGGAGGGAGGGGGNVIFWSLKFLFNKLVRTVIQCLRVRWSKIDWQVRTRELSVWEFLRPQNCDKWLLATSFPFASMELLCSRRTGFHENHVLVFFENL